MKTEFVLISWCILGLLLVGGCSKGSPEGARETIAETPSDPIVPADNKSIASRSFTQTNRGSLTNAKISEGAEPILRYLNSRPLLEWLSALKPEDKMLLLSRYRTEAQLTNKLSLTIALSFLGDEEVAEEFRKTLLGTPFDHVLDSNEEDVILFTVEGLGRIAHKYDSGLPFLRQATDPRYWKQNAPWKTHLGERQYGVVAGRALYAIAMSGAPDAREIFEQVKANPYVTDAEGSGWVLGAAVVDAVFLADFIQERGFEALKAMYDQGVMEAYRPWTGTDNGKKWVSWWRQWEKDHPKESGVPQLP